MIIDHIAYRSLDRNKTSSFLCKLYDYTIQDEFWLDFQDGSKARCYSLGPKDKYEFPYTYYYPYQGFNPPQPDIPLIYHKPPEFFVSEGEEGSIVWNWLKAKGIESGVHHVALSVDSVRDTIKWCKDNKMCEFSTEEPIWCESEGLLQIFTKEVPELGHVIEFIERKGKGFCNNNIKILIESSK